MRFAPLPFGSNSPMDRYWYRCSILLPRIFNPFHSKSLSSANIKVQRDSSLIPCSAKTLLWTKNTKKEKTSQSKQNFFFLLQVCYSILHCDTETISKSLDSNRTLFEKNNKKIEPLWNILQDHKNKQTSKQKMIYSQVSHSHFPL